MTARDILSVNSANRAQFPEPKVDSMMPLLDVIPRLLDANARELTVIEEGEPIGVITESSLLEGLGNMIAARDDCSVITLDCDPADYCASIIAHAIEDTDAHLVDLFTSPGDNGRILATLRVRQSDPTAAVRSLERYDFHVIDAYSSGSTIQNLEIATERLLSLQALMNV